MLPLKRRSQYICMVLLSSLIFLNGSDQLSAAPHQWQTVEWSDLIPQSDLDILLNPPESIQNIVDGSPEDRLPPRGDTNSSSIEEAVANAIREANQQRSPEEIAYYAALASTEIKPEYDQKSIRIAGFIVPIQYNDEMIITEFFLVPYFGACLHLPPPPPNQVIHVVHSEGVAIEHLYTPFWVQGLLSTSLVENDIALSAYSMTANQVELYQQ